MNHSESLVNLAAALHKAQGMIEGARKDSKNPFFKNTYADLESVWDSCQPALQATGLAVSQFPINNGNGVGVLTILMHSSGEWISEEFVLPLAKQDPQGGGSAITYSRRYALMAVLGICPIDDDAEAAVGRGRQQQRQAPQKPAPQKPDQRAVEDWSVALDNEVETVADLNDMLPGLGSLSQETKKIVWDMIGRLARSRGWEYVGQQKQFVAKEVVA